VSRLELRIPPPLVALLCALAMYGLARLVPTWLWVLPYAGAMAACTVVAGIAIAIAGVHAFRTHRTTVNPLHPEKTTAVVTTGIYRHTRNPMYLGMLVVLLGIAIWLGSAVAPLMLPVFVLYLTRFQIVPEERALLAKFGSQYVDYMLRVRRWF
jgi:protein-S-isoprenylcysteine O-methyltransferase Ste14